MAGRPWKYKPLVDALPEGELFHTGKIIRYCEGIGLFDFSLDDPDRRHTPEEKKRAKKNARSALAQLAAKKMPAPDGKVQVEKPYEASFKAWYGRTWKRVLIGE